MFCIVVHWWKDHSGKSGEQVMSQTTPEVRVIHHRQKFGFRFPLFTAARQMFSCKVLPFSFGKKNPCWNQIYFVKSVLTDVWWMLQRIQANNYSWIKYICKLKLFCVWCFSFCSVGCCSQPDLRLRWGFFSFYYYFFHTALSLEGSAVPLFPSLLQYAAASWEASEMTRCVPKQNKTKQKFNYQIVLFFYNSYQENHLHRLPWWHHRYANGLQLLFLCDGFSSERKMVFDYCLFQLLLGIMALSHFLKIYISLLYIT